MFAALEKNFANTDQAKLIDILYQGEMKDYVKCLECSYENAKTDLYLDIPLSIKPFGAQVCFASFLVYLILNNL